MIAAEKPKSDTGRRYLGMRAADLGWTVASGELGRYAYEKHAEDDDFGQAGSLFRDVMDDTDREHLVTNIVAHASDRVTDEVQLRVIAYWTTSTRDWAPA